ncbi:MAG: hypothetical protein AAF713_21810 [Pseudomonadota bacterium]
MKPDTLRVDATTLVRAGTAALGTDGEVFFARGPSTVHSAHVGEFAVFRYRLHALFGLRVRIERLDRGKAGPFVHVEVLPGVVTVVAAWMLDA